MDADEERGQEKKEWHERRGCLDGRCECRLKLGDNRHLCIP